MSYICYTLRSSNNKYLNRTYTGITNNSTRRLRQHNGELKGGARATKIIRPVRYYIIISNLSKSKALSIERTIHNMKNRKDKKYIGVIGSLICVCRLLEQRLIKYDDISIV
jgi:predicted GIY-YIG superfamily endonuclease